MTPNNTEQSALYNAVQGRITSVCSSIGIPVYDMNSKFESIRKLRGIELSELLVSDGVHPNDDGYDIMYDAALELFGI